MEEETRNEIANNDQCDERLPECTQCVSKQKRCPGPIMGTVFIDMTTKKKQVVPLPDNIPVESQSSQHLEIGPYSEITTLSRKNKIYTKTTSNILFQTRDAYETSLDFMRKRTRQVDSVYAQYMLPSSYQPSNAKPFQQLFLSQFVSDLDAQSIRQDPLKAWWKELPAILEASSNTATQCSLRAMTMAHYGNVAEDASIQTEARKWYDKSLCAQRQSLQGKCGIEDVLSTAMLGVFELLLEGMPTAWIQHILAGSKLLALWGPEYCQTGLAHKLFRAIRPMIVSSRLSSDDA